MYPHPTDTTKFRFVDDSGEPGTRDVMNTGTADSANSDTWDREDQASLRGVDQRVVTRILSNSSDQIIEFSRILKFDADGHLVLISAETRSITATLVADTVACTTPMEPDDAAISSSLTNWLIADDISGIDGDAVGTWTAATGANATQTTASFKPTLKTNLYNTHKAVRFDGTDDYLDWSTVLQSVEAGDFTLFVVALGSTGRIISDYWQEVVSPADKKKGINLSPDGRFDTYEYSSANILDGAKTAGLASLGVQACAVTNNGSTRNVLFLNGAEDTTSVSGGVVTCSQSPSNTYLGAAPASPIIAIAKFLNGDIAEVIVYSAKLTDDQIQKVSCHLMDKYGL
jgi:hypothetical protein